MHIRTHVRTLRVVDVITLSNGSKVSREEFQAWLDALNFRKYRQTRGELQNSDGYCCLGVACRVLVPDYEVDVDTYLLGGIPNIAHGAPTWLEFINEDFLYKTGKKLTTLNDQSEFTFKEIAEVLKLVYLDGYSVDLSELGDERDL